MLTDAHSCLQSALSWAGRLNEIDTDAPETAPMAERIGNVGAVVFYDNARFIAQWCRTADLQALEAHAKHVGETWGRAGPWSIFGSSFSVSAHFLRGDWDAAAKLYAGVTDDLPGVWAGYFWGGLFEANRLSKYL